MGRKILVVDDDYDLLTLLEDLLCSNKFEVDCAEDPADAYDMLAEKKFDMIILDVNMPGESGLSFCREVRKMSNVPIIFISAKNGEYDKIAGLDLGGDDYICKPFSLKELISRVNALMRRVYGTESEPEISVGELEINALERCVRKNGKEVKLSLKEFDVLLYLAKNKNTAVKKETLFNEVWGMFSECEVSTLSVHIRWLREKLEDNPAAPKYIKTVWGIGYSLCDGETK